MSNGRRFREQPPKFSPAQANLTLYKGNMYQQEENTTRIKVYIRNTWDWVTVKIANRDYRDLLKISAQVKKICNPSIVYKDHKFYLAFPIEYQGVAFCDTPLEDQTVLAVDLGINHGAVCSVLNCKGQVSARMFDPFSKERRALDKNIQTIRYAQKRAGVKQSISRVYQKLDGRKDNYVKQLAHWLVT